VKREDFLGRGPWQRGYVRTPNPIFLYDDVLVGIVPERNLNVASRCPIRDLIAERRAPRSGEHVVHVGAGVGYYTAILHHLAGV